MKFLKTLLAASAASMLALASTSSNATLTLTLEDLSTATLVTVVDNGVGDTNGTEGLITFGGSVGVWNATLSLGAGTAVLDPFGIDLFSAALLNTAASTLRVSLVETGLSEFSGGLASVTGSIGGTTTGVVDYDLMVDAATAFSGSSVDHTTGGLAFSDSGSSSMFLSDPYSLTLSVDITHAAAMGDTTLDFRASIPEPTSLALISLALLGAGAATRRRKG